MGTGTRTILKRGCSYSYPKDVYKYRINNIQLTRLKLALETKNRYDLRLFLQGLIWDGLPQGYTYWNNKYYDPVGRITKEDYEFLEKLLPKSIEDKFIETDY